MVPKQANIRMTGERVKADQEEDEQLNHFGSVVWLK